MTVAQPALAPPRIVSYDAADGSRVLRSEMETFSQDYLNIIKRHFLR